MMDGPTGGTPNMLPSSDLIQQEHPPNTNANPFVESMRSFAHGTLPPNQVLDETLEKTRLTLDNESRRSDLDESTRKTAVDIGRLVEDAQMLLRERNSDEKMQRFLLDAKEARKELELARKEKKKNLAHTNYEEHKRERTATIHRSANDVVDACQELLKLLATSRDFRSVLLDVFSVLSEISAAERTKVDHKHPELARDPPSNSGLTFDRQPIVPPSATVAYQPYPTVRQDNHITGTVLPNHESAAVFPNGISSNTFLPPGFTERRAETSAHHPTSLPPPQYNNPHNPANAPLPQSTFSQLTTSVPVPSTFAMVTGQSAIPQPNNAPLFPPLPPSTFSQVTASHPPVVATTVTTTVVASNHTTSNAIPMGNRRDQLQREAYYPGGSPMSPRVEPPSSKPLIRDATNTNYPSDLHIPPRRPSNDEPSASRGEGSVYPVPHKPEHLQHVNPNAPFTTPNSGIPNSGVSRNFQAPHFAPAPANAPQSSGTGMSTSAQAPYAQAIVTPLEGTNFQTNPHYHQESLARTNLQVESRPLNVSRAEPPIAHNLPYVSSSVQNHGPVLHVENQNFNLKKDENQPGRDKTIEEAMKESTERAKLTAKELMRDIKAGTLPISEGRKRDITIKTRRLLERLAEDDNYRIAINGIMFLLQEMNRASKQMTAEGKNYRGYSPQNAPHLGNMWNDARLIIAEFVGGLAVLENWMDQIWDLYVTLKRDQRANDFFHEMKEMIYDVINDPKLLERPEHHYRWEHIIDLGRSWIEDPLYRERLHQISTASQNLLENFKEDPATKNVTSHISVLARDLILDERGRPSVHVAKEGIVRLRTLIIPLLQKHLEVIPIPRIEGHSEKFDFSVENLALAGREILPEHIRIYANNDTDFNLTTGGTLETNSYVTIHINNIEIHAHHFNFWYRKKSPPRIEDSGIIDLDVWGKNTEVLITWLLTSKTGRPTRLKAYKAECHIRHLKLHVIEAKHKVMNKLFVPMFQSQIRREAEKNVEQQLLKLMRKVSDKINDAVFHIPSEQSGNAIGITSHPMTTVPSTGSDLSAVNLQPSTVQVQQIGRPQ
eukprot:TRINITY_DN7292_c0_g1_i1.p1 TRINITY_DN7292_c0_g1~~TRINITY_DN7292_c0_g1_i1.p1  ORF type:complete len:1121 (+),score=300.74 TRINITY_DN7292_c0_g1_i1:185-3364(+)